MVISKDGWLTISFGVVALATTVTPDLQVWWLAGPLWAFTLVLGYGWHRHRGAPESLSWADIEARFKELQNDELNGARAHRSFGPLQADQNSHADQKSSNRGPDWGISGGHDTLTKRAERLCEMAGRKLKADALNSSYRLNRITDHVDRWLWFLVEIGEAPHDARWHVTGRDPEPGHIDVHLYHIGSLVKSSLAGCERCTAATINDWQTTP
jgi:hypothetical protein